MKVSELAGKNLAQLLKVAHRATSLVLVPAKANQGINENRRQGVYLRVQEGSAIRAFFVGIDPGDEDSLIVEYLGDAGAIPIIQPPRGLI